MCEIDTKINGLFFTTRHGHARDWLAAARFRVYHRQRASPEISNDVIAGRETDRKNPVAILRHGRLRLCVIDQAVVVKICEHHTGWMKLVRILIEISLAITVVIVIRRTEDSDGGCATDIKSGFRLARLDPPARAVVIGIVWRDA
jgi:hypothetical protein